MSTANTGGPAFPIPERSASRQALAFGDAQKQAPEKENGITIRDYFAGKALVAIFTQAAVMRNDAPPVEQAAKVAYRYADAMLLERAKP